MRQEAYFCTVKELDELGKNNIPRQLISHTHLIYSSPATLAFNSPGAEGFGVKRAGLAVPDSVMLIVSPGCCGRNTSVLSSMRAYQDRFYYLLMDETDIVTGRHLKNIPVNSPRFLFSFSVPATNKRTAAHAPSVVFCPLWSVHTYNMALPEPLHIPLPCDRHAPYPCQAAHPHR